MLIKQMKEEAGTKYHGDDYSDEAAIVANACKYDWPPQFSLFCKASIPERYLNKPT